MYYLKLIFKSGMLATIIMLIVLGLSALVSLVITKLLSIWGIDVNFKYFAFIAVIIGLYKFRHILSRYPYNLTFKAHRIINAPPDVVWSHIRPRARRKNYNAFVSSIKSLGDETYRYYQTGSQKYASNAPNYYDLRVRAEEKNKFIVLEVLKDENSSDDVKSAIGELTTLEELSDGRCEVRTFETHKRPSLFTIYVYLFIGAPKDVLRQLACACEDRDNISWASCEVARQSLAEAPDATLRTSLEMSEEILIITGTAFVMMLAILTTWVRL